jgi:hypothetical protein
MRVQRVTFISVKEWGEHKFLGEMKKGHVKEIRLGTILLNIQGICCSET